MDFWENLKDKVTHAGHTVAKKSTELVEITKLKVAITDTETTIDKTLRNMGEALYEAYKTGAESYTSLEESCEEIDAAYAKIEELRARIAELKDVKACPACKKEMEKDALFCSACGEKFE
ncbi:MAG: zinc ribbon domain-containing protein [Clostridia bacterium]|nr:zinc ribbon domain-containing protein [Oscillospiraceae bacterium]MBQ7034021.1 zinc ribbon domain-containing protein [Clostridia bacterium]